MRLLMENHMSIAKQEEPDNPAMPNAHLFMKNTVGAVLLFLLSLALTLWLLLPNVIGSFNDALHSQSIVEWLFVTTSGFLMGFLIGFPAVLLIHSVVDYRRARDLERLGLMTKGLLVKKWVESLDDKPVYRVRYEYLTYLSAVQTVGEETYKQINPDETLFVLYLENLPHISRLDLD